MDHLSSKVRIPLTSILGDTQFASRAATSCRCVNPPPSPFPLFENANSPWVYLVALLSPKVFPQVSCLHYLHHHRLSRVFLLPGPGHHLPPKSSESSLLAIFCRSVEMEHRSSSASRRCSPFGLCKQRLPATNEGRHCTAACSRLPVAAAGGELECCCFAAILRSPGCSHL